ncbi:MAG TPA: DinB family protein [Gemmataceae bacterium]|nr:DinB family protein [Gemmataceae bacterium]
MDAKEAIRSGLKFTQSVLGMYLADLSDADLLVRPVPQANHIAWQLGHLIGSEASLAKHVPNASYPPLPAGWAEQHGKETAAVDPPTGFKSKEEYLSLFNRVREATLAALDKIAVSDLDKPTGWNVAPTVGALFNLNAHHVLMHAGQFTVVRRKLGKPVIM